jgi:glycine/D-amino acid oxidase-like deaminating enzyme
LSKIAVIGGGIFGSVGALSLAEAGHEVTLFEKESQILTKGTQNSQNRLHLGLHYPRDLETAKQSVSGFRSFLERFADSVDFNFPNYYALASRESRTNREDFLKFACDAEILIKEVEPRSLDYLGVRQTDYQGIWTCEEGVIDVPTLRKMIQNEIIQSNLRIQPNTEITKAIFGKGWTLVDQNQQSHVFDQVFRCTYGSDNIAIEKTNYIERNYEFHKTAILNVTLEQDRFGFTIVDGDFLTVLPEGKSPNSLIYAPSISTRLRHQGATYPAKWNDETPEYLDAFKDKILERLNNWLPEVNVNHVNKVMTAIRSIEPNVSQTDRRTSSIQEVAPNFYDIWSGKIDHCVDLSKRMVKLIQFP